MKETHMEGIANHRGPESCGCVARARVRSVDRGPCRRGIDLRKKKVRSADPVATSGKATRETALCRKPPSRLRGVVDPMHARDISSRENREISLAARTEGGPVGEMPNKPDMDGNEKSDMGVVASKGRNETALGGVA
jgi:hypothetical protein